MKKMTALLIIALTIVLCSCSDERSTSKIRDIAVQSDYIRYEYSPLKQASEIIIRAEIIDELTDTNSMLVTDEDDSESISDFYAIRKAKILDVYFAKNKVKVGAIVNVIEDAAMSAGVYYHGENYKTLEKGGEYILFLNKDNAGNEYSIISANNGKVCTSDLGELSALEDENFEIAVKALVEYDSKLSKEEIATVLNSQVVRSSNKTSLEKEIELGAGSLKYESKNGIVEVALNS